VLASIVAAPPFLPPSSSLSSLYLSPSIPTLAADPPPPFQLCPWPRFVSLFLPPAAAEAVHARVVGARTDAAACIYFLLIRTKNRGMTGMGPIRGTMRDFLVCPDATTRRLMREHEPLFLLIGREAPKLDPR
jgi:hypothetical protein